MKTGDKNNPPSLPLTTPLTTPAPPHRLVRQEVAENDVPQALLREVPEQRADLADLVHEVQADRLLCVVKRHDLHVAEVHAPRRGLAP